MKVYIVTQGEYSAYRIEKVFLNKEKAEKYAKYKSTDYDECFVEEYDTYDENLIAKKHYIKCFLHYDIEILNDRVEIIYRTYNNYAKYVTMKKEFNDLIIQRKPNSFCEAYNIIKYFDEDKYDMTTALKELEKIGYDIRSEFLEYIKDYNLKKAFEIICSKYKHDVNLKDLEEVEENDI